MHPIQTFVKISTENHLFPDAFTFLSYVLSVLENFVLMLSIKDLFIKKHVNSNFNVDRDNVIANKIVMHFLGLYV